MLTLSTTPKCPHNPLPHCQDKHTSTIQYKHDVKRFYASVLLLTESLIFPHLIPQCQGVCMPLVKYSCTRMTLTRTLYTETRNAEKPKFKWWKAQQTSPRTPLKGAATWRIWWRDRGAFVLLFWKFHEENQPFFRNVDNK